MCTIPVFFYKMPQNLDNISKFFKSIKPSSSTMIFLSSKCYEYVKNNFIFILDSDCTNYCKTFMAHSSNNDRLYLSLTPIYAGDLFYLEKIFSSKIKYKYTSDLPSQIIFILLDDEEIGLKPKVKVLSPNPCDCPVTCIMDDYKEFKSSLFMLTHSAYNRLIKNTTLTSSYGNSLRLYWEADNDYPGGKIYVRSLNNGINYLIEDMIFPFFCKNFCLKTIPVNIYLII